MKTPEGAQRILDYRVFKHNYGKFPTHIRDTRRKYEKWRALLKETHNHPTLRGGGNYFKSRFKKLDIWHGNYKEIWNQYFTIL
jgi:hypothetical protein